MRELEDALRERAAGRAESGAAPGVQGDANPLRAYDYWAYNAACLAAPPPLDQSPRARAMREINRIAARRRWGDEVARWMDRAAAGRFADLDDAQLEGLRDHMRRLEDCGHTACDPDDEFPAR